MLKDFFHILFTPKPEEIQEPDYLSMDLEYFVVPDFELKFPEDDYYVSRLIISDEFRIFNFDIDKRFKAILRHMQLQLYQKMCSVKIHAYSLIRTISLLFGLCSSQSSTIFSAYFGTSLSRIPSM